MRSCEAVLRTLEQAQAAQRERLVVAPVTRGGRIRVSVERLIWACRLADDFEGWGVFRIAPTHLAHLEREATVAECEAWARRRKTSTVIVVERTGICWDIARHRMIGVALIGSAEPCDALRVCHDGAHWWSMGPDPAVPVRVGTRLLERRGVDYRDDEGDSRRVEAALAHAGATLVSIRSLGPDQREVTWSKQGQRFVSIVDGHLGVVSAGLCLSGRDAEHDLLSLASLIGHFR